MIISYGRIDDFILWGKEVNFDSIKNKLHNYLYAKIKTTKIHIIVTLETKERDPSKNINLEFLDFKKEYYEVLLKLSDYLEIIYVRVGNLYCQNVSMGDITNMINILCKNTQIICYKPPLHDFYLFNLPIKRIIVDNSNNLQLHGIIELSLNLLVLYNLKKVEIYGDRNFTDISYIMPEGYDLLVQQNQLHIVTT